jgi:hypothetical protein
VPTLRRFEAGQVLVFRSSFFDDATNLPIDPTLVEFQYRVDGGDLTEYVYGIDPEVLRIDVGVYEMLMNTIGAPGLYTYVWASHGQGQTAATKAVIVHPAIVATTFDVHTSVGNEANIVTSESSSFTAMIDGEYRKAFREGQLIRFNAVFTNKITGAPLDPSQVEFVYVVVGADTAPVSYIYGASDHKIGRTAQGCYTIALDSSGKIGEWNFTWSSENSGQSILSKSILVRPVDAEVVW